MFWCGRGEVCCRFCVKAHSWTSAKALISMHSLLALEVTSQRRWPDREVTAWKSTESNMRICDPSEWLMMRDLIAISQNLYLFPTCLQEAWTCLRQKWMRPKFGRQRTCQFWALDGDTDANLEQIHGEMKKVAVSCDKNLHCAEVSFENACYLIRQSPLILLCVGDVDYLSAGSRCVWYIRKDNGLFTCVFTCGQRVDIHLFWIV